jgi:hypothetical protein
MVRFPHHLSDVFLLTLFCATVVDSRLYLQGGGGFFIERGHPSNM